MNNGIITILLGTILSGGLMSACAGNPDPTNTLTLADHGSEVTVSKGQIVELQLASNPSTGYTWEISELDTDLLDWSGEVEYTSQSDLAGAGGVEIFRFKARNTGRSQLSLIYHRSWEEDVEPETVFTITVIVE